MTYAHRTSVVFAHLGNRLPMNCVIVALAAETCGTWDAGRADDSLEEALSVEGGDQDGNVLDILVQSRRNKKATKKFFRKLLTGLHYVPRVIITFKLRRYGAAKHQMLPGVEHRQHKHLNHRAENSHQPTRLRDREHAVRANPQGMQSVLLSAFGPISSHFQPRRHRLSAVDYHAILQTRFQTWNEIAGVKMVG